MAQKQRWIKVTVEFREGALNAWDAQTLGETSMVRRIEGTGADDFDDLSSSVWTAAAELVSRSNRLVPPTQEPIEELVATT